MDDNIENKKWQEPQGEKVSNRFWPGFLLGIFVMSFIMLVTFSVRQVINIYFMQNATARNAKQQETKKEKIASETTLQKIDVLQETIEAFYLDGIKYEDLEEGMYYGVVDALGDPYSTYYSVEELKEIEEQSQGIYYGVGSYIGMDQTTQLPKLSKIIENTPAEAIGLLENDIIIKVGDMYTKGLELSDVVAKIKGEEGTKVLLTIFREGETDYLEFEVERRKIESPTVEYKMLEGNIGYIEIREFDDVTIDQFKEAYVVLQGQKMNGLVIDLRSNPGGNLSAVVEIARMILPKGMIVYTEDKNGERIEYTSKGETPINMPLSVLINGNSASASEILAGAIKDYNIGTLVGTTTYGKGIVQRVLTLSDGSAVKLTVSKYYTPNGKNIHDVGIEPDVEIEFDPEAYLSDETDNQLEKAVEIIKEKLE